MPAGTMVPFWIQTGAQNESDANDRGAKFLARVKAAMPEGFSMDRGTAVAQPQGPGAPVTGTVFGMAIFIGPSKTGMGAMEETIRGAFRKANTEGMRWALGSEPSHDDFEG